VTVPLFPTTAGTRFQPGCRGERAGPAPKAGTRLQPGCRGARPLDQAVRRLRASDLEPGCNQVAGVTFAACASRGATSRPLPPLPSRSVTDPLRGGARRPARSGPRGLSTAAHTAGGPALGTAATLSPATRDPCDQRRRVRRAGQVLQPHLRPRAAAVSLSVAVDQQPARRPCPTRKLRRSTPPARGHRDFRPRRLRMRRDRRAATLSRDPRRHAVQPGPAAQLRPAGARLTSSPRQPS
jgi:hypothetical protein